MKSQKALAAELLEICLKNNWKISCAESCTGGLLCSILTKFAGASSVFQCGLITYSNQAKNELLGVSIQTLEKFGAVSKETAHEMVLGLRKIANTEIAIAITGIAGPNGGSKVKPVGTVFIGLAVLDEIWTVEEKKSVKNRLKMIEKSPEKSVDGSEFFIDRNRLQIQKSSINSALKNLVKKIKFL